MSRNRFHRKLAFPLLALALFAVRLRAEPCCQPLPLAEALRSLSEEEPGRTLRIDLDGDGVGEEVRIVRTSEGEARIEADVDGDGIRDSIRYGFSSGSGMASWNIALVPSRSGGKIEVGAESSYSAMLGRTAIPEELLAPGLERALGLVEAALFGCLCAHPDPSLAWLLEKAPRSLAWVEGPPSLPDSYTLRQGDEWLSYAGGAHRGLLRKPSEPEIVPFASDPRTGYVLARTAHGVLLVDEGGARHAWLYVTQDGQGQKLRFPTVVDGRLEGQEAVVRLSHERAFDGDYGCGLLRIHLDDGALSESWRELDSAGADMEACWAGLEKDARPVPVPPVP